MRSNIEGLMQGGLGDWLAGQEVMRAAAKGKAQVKYHPCTRGEKTNNPINQVWAASAIVFPRSTVQIPTIPTGRR
jgi:hypothetical protein